MNATMNLPFESKQLIKAKGIIDRFIYSCSHRLRSPLTSIEGLLMIAGYCTSPSELNQCLTLIQQCTLNMLSMIENLEEYTTIQNRQLNSQSVDAHALVQKIEREFETEIKEQNVLVLSNVIQPTVWSCDEECVHVILSHLVNNAIVYSDKEKAARKISITIDVTSEEAILEVTDNGIGIPTMEKEKIFDPFHRSSNQGNGNGLGLFVVKGVVEKLKANITVQTAESFGTSFRVTIPNKA